MSGIISQRQTIRYERYGLDFAWKDANGNATGGGFSFPCDKDGNVLKNEMKPTGLANLQDCLDGTIDVLAQGVVDYSYDYRQPAQLRCQCNQIISLENSMTNECDVCGRLYNMSGQLLAPRSQWGERGE